MLLSLAPAGAQAGEAVTFAERAERALAEGQPAKAHAAAREALFAIWKRMPLTIRRAVFVRKPAAGYGIYNPREAVFRSGEKLLVYLEPVGYGFDKAAKGVYRFQFTVDLTLASADGKILGGKEGFARFPMTSRERNSEFYMSLDLDLGKAPEGKYVLILTIRDDVKGQTASVRMPFEIKG
jgi:hypothetical protein